MSDSIAAPECRACASLSGVPRPSGRVEPAGSHTAVDDAQGLLVSILLVSLGVTLYQGAGLLTGGTAGLAFLVQYVCGLNFGAAFFVLNLPFYWLALTRMGRRFTAKTFLSVSLVSACSGLTAHVVTFHRLSPLYAAIAGGVLLGIGFLIQFRHRSSLGGVSVLAFYLQEQKGWRAGKVQLAFDGVIVAAALVALDPVRAGYSVVGAIALNLLIAVNHRPGRYVGA